MLYLISLGLHDEKDMSLKALEAAKKCKKLYVEFYTLKMNTSAKTLSKLMGKKVTEIKRSDMEENSLKILREAKKSDVGIFVGGDALVATTHTSLLIDAKKLEIDTKVIHGSSILSAVGETGLQIYKFGKTTTLAIPEENYYPKSCYDAIELNKKTGLHTLVLLDIKNKKTREDMTVSEGLKTLLDIEKEKKEGLIKPETMVVAACQLGGKSIIKYGKVKDLIKDKTLDKTPAVLIVLGELHFMEKEFLELIISPDNHQNHIA